MTSPTIYIYIYIYKAAHGQLSGNNSKLVYFAWLIHDTGLCFIAYRLVLNCSVLNRISIITNFLSYLFILFLAYLMIYLSLFI